MLLLVSIPLCTFVLYHIRDTNYDVEKVVHVEDVQDSQIEGAAVPKGHHTDEVHAVRVGDEKASHEMKEHEAAKV
jgi:hypothetical protein